MSHDIPRSSVSPRDLPSKVRAEKEAAWRTLTGHAPFWPVDSWACTTLYRYLDEDGNVMWASDLAVERPPTGARELLARFVANILSPDEMTGGMDMEQVRSVVAYDLATRREVGRIVVRCRARRTLRRAVGESRHRHTPRCLKVVNRNAPT